MEVVVCMVVFVEVRLLVVFVVLCVVVVCVDCVLLWFWKW